MDDDKNISICLITKHAYKRAKERLGWKKKTLDRMCDDAFTEGLTHSETKGSLHKYVSYLWNRNKNANNIRVYNESIFIFCGVKLVTVHGLPTKMMKRANYTKAKRN